MPYINWKVAINNILPWIKEEMEKNGLKEKNGKRSIKVTKTMLMDKMGILSEERNMNIAMVCQGFRRQIINKGFDIKFYKGDILIIVEDLIVKRESRQDSEICLLDSDQSIRQKLEEESNIRKSRYGKGRKTISDYKEKVGLMLSHIKKGIDKSGDGIYTMSIECVHSYLGKEFDIYSHYTIFYNVRTAMEDHNIIVGAIFYKKNHIEYLTFRYKQEGDQFIWEKDGFFSREEYEDCIKEDRKCGRIKPIGPVEP